MDEFDQFDQFDGEDGTEDDRSAEVAKALFAFKRGTKFMTRRQDDMNAKWAEDRKGVAEIANGMSRALAESTRAMEEMKASNAKVAEDVAAIARDARDVVEAETVKSLRLIDECVREAVEKEVAKEIERATKASMAAVVAATAACAPAPTIALLAAIWLMRPMLDGGGSWPSFWGWLALTALAVASACGAGYLVIREMRRGGGER